MVVARSEAEIQLLMPFASIDRNGKAVPKKEVWSQPELSGATRRTVLRLSGNKSDHVHDAP